MRYCLNFYLNWHRNLKRSKCILSDLQLLKMNMDRLRFYEVNLRVFTIAYQRLNTVVCVSLETRIHYLAVVFIFVKIQKLLIYVLKDLKICHKFQH